MEKTTVDAQKDGYEKEDSLLSLHKEIEVTENHNLEFFESKSKRPLRRGNPEQMFLNVKQSSKNGERCIRDSFVHSYGTNFGIPKHMVSRDVKYLSHCLDLLQVRASNPLSIACRQAALSNVSSSSEVMFHGIKPPKSRRRNTFDFDTVVVECRSAAGPGNVVITPVGRLIVSTIAGNNDVRNIFKDPLFRYLGAVDSHVNLGKEKAVNFKELLSSDFMNSPSGLSTSLSQKLQKEKVHVGNQRYGSEAVHKRLVSLSSTSSTCSDKSSSSSGVVISQGMIKCISKNGIPYFMFYVDDRKEVYVANPWKVESSDDKALDYMYLFHSRTEGEKENRICDNLLKLVGKMKVSTSVTLYSDNSKLKETEFVLFGAKENQVGDMQRSTPTLKKNKGLSKKMVEVFKTNHSVKHRTIPRCVGSSTLCEDFSWEPCQDTFNKLDAWGRTNLLEDNPPPNLELAAIVMKDYLHDSCLEKAEGGWGLKFLKKTDVERSTTSVEASVSSQSCQESNVLNGSDCSTSISVLVPGDLHGGPRTRNGGPSSLTERWRTGGNCDCGGWDMGCPLTVLNNTSSLEVLHQTESRGGCKPFDLFPQGAKQDVPVLKMAYIRDGLYLIHFESTLSALQSFSIAVAVIHMQFPTLHLKNVEKLKLKE